MKSALKDYLIQMNTDLILKVNALKLVEQAIEKVKANTNYWDRLKNLFVNSNVDPKDVFQLVEHGIALILGKDEPKVDEKVNAIKFNFEEVDAILNENIREISGKVVLARIFDSRRMILEGAIRPLINKKLASLVANQQTNSEFYEPYTYSSE